MTTNQRGHTPLLVVLGVVVLVAISASGYIVWHHKTASTPPTASTSGGTSGSTSQPALLTTGTSNADLTSNLNSINTSLSKESSDQTSTGSAINDQGNQISVPTN